MNVPRPLRAGDIGEPKRHIELIPADEPTTAPLEIPMPVREPEKVPA